MEKLTRIQKDILVTIRQRVTHGRPAPSYRDLCAEFGWSSTGTARDHLKALERKGYLQLPRNRGGRVMLCESPPASAVAPIVGHIVAGTPIEAEELRYGQVSYPAEWSNAGSCFALEVSGDSMVNAGILEGDHVVVRPQETARSGEIVAATVDGETTLKRLVRDGSKPLLVAENPRYRAIPIETESASIHGVVVGLLRAYQTSVKRLAKSKPACVQQPVGEYDAHRT